MGGAGTLWVCSAVVPAEAAEDLADWMRATFALEPVLLERPGSAHAWLELYLEDEASATDAAGRMRSLDGVLDARVRVCPERAWTTFWRHHFKTRPVGRSFLLVPAWEAEQVPADTGGRLPLVIEPGFSFGTGDHFTTCFCLESIEDTPPDQRESLLDAGTGSGVLALAAARLGFRRILAFDVDPACLPGNEANAQLNGLAAHIDFTTADLRSEWDPRGPFDVVCANILSSILIEQAGKLSAWCRHRLILSGIREPETDAVADTFRARSACAKPSVTGTGNGAGWLWINLDT